jgi:hypothetical protein
VISSQRYVYSACEPRAWTLGSRLLRRCAARTEVLVGETVRLNMRFLIGASAFSLPTSGLSTKHRTHSRCQDGGLCRWDGVARSRAARLASIHQVGGHIITSGSFQERLGWLGQPFCLAVRKRRPIKCVCPAPFLIRRFRRRTRRASPNGNCGRLRQRHNARQGQRPVTHHAKRWLSHVPISPTDSETSESIDACAKTIGPQHHCLHRNDKRLL